MSILANRNVPRVQEPFVVVNQIWPIAIGVVRSLAHFVIDGGRESLAGWCRPWQNGDVPKRNGRIYITF